jgi:hypothetical protein
MVALAEIRLPEPYDTWSEQDLAKEIDRLKIVRDNTNRLIEDMIDRRIELLHQKSN